MLPINKKSILKVFKPDIFFTRPIFGNCHIFTLDHGNPIFKFQPQQITGNRINDFIDEQLGDWAQNVQNLLIQNIRTRRLFLSQDLINSFGYQVKYATANTGAAVQLAFLDYGRMKDMKGLF